MAHLEKMTGEEGVDRIGLPRAISEALRWTQIQKIIVSKDTYQEPADPDRVKFIYVIQGEGSFSSGVTQTVVRKGATLFIGEGGPVQIIRTSWTPLIFLRLSVRKDAGLVKQEG